MKNRSRIALLVVALFMLFTVSIAATQSSAKVVTIIDDKQVAHYETEAQNVQELLQQLEITLGEKDAVEPMLDTEITDNMKITIERWRPTVSLKVNGESKSQKTKAQTVDEFLKSLGVNIQEGDEVTPSTETSITDGLQIEVKTKEVKTEVEDRPMQYSTKIVETADMAYGETKVSQQGKNGLKTVTIQREYLGGELVNDYV